VAAHKSGRHTASDAIGPGDTQELVIRFVAGCAFSTSRVRGHTTEAAHGVFAIATFPGATLAAVAAG
jgi:hypothetical protein